MTVKIPWQLDRAINELYLPAGYTLTEMPTPESESAEYSAYRFKINSNSIIYRIAKATPKKKGQFVTFWQREVVGAPITPFHIKDDFDYLIIGVNNETHIGNFIFDKTILLKQGIIKDINTKGKLSFRVYPPSISVENKTAFMTQRWQAEYFVEIKAVAESRTKFKELLLS